MTSPFDHGCTYVDPKTGAPCLKSRGHDDIKGGWRCPYGCPDGPGADEPFTCPCGMQAQAPSQHLTMSTMSGPVLKIVPLEEFKLAETWEGYYSSSLLEGVITRGVGHEDSCATKKAPPGTLLVGPYACDCGGEG